MPLNESKGNMYPFVTHTWNTVKGKCPHDCSYCYMKKWGEPPALHFDKLELETDLGRGNFIFVGSSCDMWAWNIPEEWILETLNHCNQYPSNRYLFQSKNPQRFRKYYGLFPDNTVFGVTIESNRDYEIGPPTILDRYCSAAMMSSEDGAEMMITIEPIMDFDLYEMAELIGGIHPLWINIGANTNHKVQLIEPMPEKIIALIKALEQFTEVRIKDNLQRLMSII